MQILIVGIGALGGTIAARAIRAGLPVRLAARNTDSADALRSSGLRVTGIGGEVRAEPIEIDVAAVEDYGRGDRFDLILLATKAWVEAIVGFYGDVKPSMLQDFERGRKTEVDFINGYVVRLGGASGLAVRMNTRITELVHQIERGALRPAIERLNELDDVILSVSAGS